MNETKNRPVVAHVEISKLSDNLPPVSKDAEISVNIKKEEYIMRKFSNYSEKKASHYAYTYNCDINSPMSLPKSVNELVNMSDSDIMRYSKILPFNYGSYQNYLTAKYILARCHKIYNDLQDRRKFEHKFENACSHPVRYYKVFDRTCVREREAWEAPNTERVFDSIELSDNYTCVADIINQLYETWNGMLKIEPFVRGLVKTVAQQNYFHDGSGICADIVANGYNCNSIYDDMVQVVALQLLAIDNDTVNYDGMDFNFRQYIDDEVFDYYIWIEDGKLRVHPEVYKLCCRAIRRICAKYRNPRFEVEKIAKKAEDAYKESDEKGRQDKVGFIYWEMSRGIQSIVEYAPEIQKFFDFVAENTDKADELFELIELKADAYKPSEIQELLGITDGQYRQRCNKIKKLRNLFYRSAQEPDFYKQYKSWDKIMRTNGR